MTVMIYFKRLRLMARDAYNVLVYSYDDVAIK